MKKAKKMLLAASALALVSFGFGGCTGEEIGEESIINVTKNTGTKAEAKINEMNTISTGSKASYLRNFVPVKYEHTQALCRITMSKPGTSTVKGFLNNKDWIKDETKSDSISYASVMGFGFNNQKVDGNNNLYIVGVRMKPGTTDTPEAYVSCFEGVSDDGFNNGSSFGTEYGWDKTAQEWVVDSSTTNNIHSSSDFFELDKSLFMTGDVIDLYVGVYFKDNKYTVSIIQPTAAVDAIDDVESAEFGAAVMNGVKLLDGVPLKNTAKGAKGYIGFYANVAPDGNLIGTWNKTASKNAEIAEAE